MLTPLRNSFINLLVLLQLLLPLLHAHSGIDNSPIGIHLHNPELVSIVVSAFDQPSVASIDKLIPSEGIIVVASTGIGHKTVLLDNAQDILFFKADAQYITPLFVPNINIIPPTADFYSCSCWNPSSPRAPPAYSIST